MPDQTPLENAERLVTTLSPQEQTQLIARINERLSKAPPSSSTQIDTIRSSAHGG